MKNIAFIVAKWLAIPDRIENIAVETVKTNTGMQGKSIRQP
jgi:hypothetical protein